MSVKEHNGCKFIKAWIGTCKKETVDNTEYCREHKEKLCRCGNQSTHDCDITVGPLVCGSLLCSKCNDDHMKIAHHMF